MEKKLPIDLRVRIYFGSSTALGPGKIALLEEIELGGSLARAARELGMSYRRAWGLLRDLSEVFGEPVAVTTVGGREGGGAELTPFAHEIIAAYRSVERAGASAAEREFAFVLRRLSSRKRTASRHSIRRTRRGSRPARKRS
jgi:molybdate transport system regulatory protein